jgi:hypothetical protein
MNLRLNLSLGHGRERNGCRVVSCFEEATDTLFPEPFAR